MPERTQHTLYRVVNLSDGRVWDCKTARAVCSILWSQRPATDFAIFKNGRRWRRRISGEVNEFMRTLAKWHPKPAAKEESNDHSSH